MGSDQSTSKTDRLDAGLITSECQIDPVAFPISAAGFIAAPDPAKARGFPH